MKENIVPNLGMAGIEIGQSLSELEEKVESINKVNGQTFAYMCNKTVFILFDDHSNVFQISALKGYKGKLRGKFYVGQSIKEIVDNDWIFSEEVDGFVKADLEGVVIRVDLEDATTEEIFSNIERLLVDEITVAPVI